MNQNNIHSVRRTGRRRFLRKSAVGAASLVLPASVVGRKASRAAPDDPFPNEKLNIAGVGLGVRGLGNLEKCHGANIVAVCDVDWSTTSVAMRRFPAAAKYQDFRRMLDREKGIDAVVVSTPDHSHAVIAAEAMRRKKHVFVEAPLAHSVWEVRRLTELARENGVMTQMGNERHSGAGIRKAVEMLWGGGLGPIREVHSWTNRPQWPQGITRPDATPPVPEGLDWDLWLGPAPRRPYHPAYHPYRWRGWQDFGTGALGAMGCHLIDVAFWGLRLYEAGSFSVTANAEDRNTETYPIASTIEYRFPSRGDLPPVTLTWYDGGRKPEPPEQMPVGREIGSNGTLFQGEKVSMMFGPTIAGTTPGQIGPRTVPEFAKVEKKTPVKKIPRVPEGDWTRGDRHIQEWMRACRTGKAPSSNFDVSGPLTEMVLLGNVALGCDGPIEWNRDRLEITNMPEANHRLRPEYRKGWRL